MDDNKGRSRKRKTLLEQLTFSKGVKKTLALLTATVMMLTGVDFTGITEAYAATTSINQIVDNPEKKSAGSIDKGLVEVKKTVSATNTENQFKITLDVTTTEKLDEVPVSADAAVVLVIDRSNSMSNNISSSDESQRMETAKKEAKKFIDSFVAANSKRMVSLVKFASNAETILIPNAEKSAQKDYWVNVSNNINKINVESAIGEIEYATNKDGDSGGTNMEGGLQLAYELIQEGMENGALDGISNVSVILLTDGCPTFHIGSQTDRDDLSPIIGMQGGGSIANYEDFQPVDGTGNQDGIAGKIMDTSVNGSKVSLYSIAFATEKSKFQNGYKHFNSGKYWYDDYIKNGGNYSAIYKWEYDHKKRGYYVYAQEHDGPPTYESKDVSDWLGSFSSRVFTAGNTSDLTSSFGSIMKLITLGIKAWKVTDPMADHIIYTGAKNSGVNDKNSFSFSETNNTLTWDLKTSDAKTRKETVNGKEVTYYEYSLEYPISLDTTAEDFPFDQGIATNNTTELTYYMFSKKDDTTIPSDPYKLNFNVPKVKGIPGAFQFTKVSKNEGASLPGAEFTLTGTATGSGKSFTKVATSGADGKVIFNNLPAGSYKLKETKAPTGFLVTEEERNVTVSFGKVTPSTLNNLKVENEVKKTTITGSKIWSGDKEEAGLRKAGDITLTLYEVKTGGAEVPTNYKASWTHTAGDTWTYEFKDVPEFDVNGNPIIYKVKETLTNGSPFTPEYGANNTITNKIKDGKLSLKKSLLNNQPAMDGDKFTLRVSGKFSDTKDSYKDFVFTSKPGEGEYPVNTVIEITGVIEGEEYAVSETTYNADRYEKAIITGTAKAAAPSSKTVPVLEIKNTLTDGVLSVKKEIAAGTEIKPEDRFILRVKGKFNDGSTYKEFTFAAEANVEQSISKVGTAVSVPNTIVEETYTVEESANANSRYVPAITADNKQAKKTGPPEILVVTNAARSGEVTIEGEKTWVDNNGITPESITIHLYQNRTEASKPFKSVTLKKGESQYKFEAIPKYNSFGEEYHYTVDEELPNGYTRTITGYDIENKYTGGEKVTIGGTKTWIRENVDENASYPDVTLGLYRNGEEKAVQTITLEDGKKDFSFAPVEKYAPDGSEYSYEVKEMAINGYESKVEEKEANQFDITNTYKPGKINISGIKVWDVPEGTKEYPTITVRLWRNGKDTGLTDTIADGKESFRFAGLDQYAPDGSKYVYTVSEENANGYDVSVNGYTITNKYKPEITEVAVRKVWEEVPAGFSHPDAEISLWRKEEGKEDTLIEKHQLTGNETYTFGNLPTVSTAGKAYTYYVTETEINGYESEETTVNGVVVFTNTYTGGKEKIRVEGTKTWIVPEGTEKTELPTITIQLLQNGNPMPGKTTTIANGGETYSFDNLPQFAPDGTPYKYAVEEKVPAGYTLTIPDESKPFDLVNTFDEATTEINGKKIWMNSGDDHPEVTINLYQSGTEGIFRTTKIDADNTYSFTGLPKYSTAGVEYQYTVEEVVPSGYTKLDPAAGDGEYDFRNEYTPDTTSVTVTKRWENMPENAVYPSVTFQLKQNGTQIAEHTIEGGTTAPTSYTFAGLLTQAPNGSNYVYTVEETPIGGYSTPAPEVNGNNVTFTNTYDPGSTSVGGTKTWAGISSEEKHPEVTIQLLQDGNPMPGKTVKLQYPAVDYVFNDLPVYATDGDQYQYTVEETKIDGYLTTYDEAHLNVTNTFTPGSVKVSGTKTWSNPTDAHPEVTVILLKNGVEFKRTTADPATGEYEFDGLPIFATDGTRNIYTVEEETINGYDPTVTLYDIHNTYKPGETSVKVTKNWASLNGAQHPEVTINLMRNDNDTEAFASITLEAGVGASQEHTFEGLPKYAPDGTEYSYTVKEVSVNGYTTTYDRSNPADVIVTNTYTGETSVKVEGTKTWTDLPEGAEHPEITIELFRSDNPSTAIDRKILEAGKHMEDSYSFTGLKKYDTLGNPYIYTVKESVLNGYESTPAGYGFVNKYTGGEEVTVEGTKTWIDVEEGQPYPVVTINLLQNGKKITDTKIENGGTSYSFTGLPKYDVNGNEYQYTVTEDKINGYASQQSGRNFTNTYTGGDTKIEIKGTKTWKNVPKGSSYPVAYIDLYQNGKVVDTKEIINGGTSYEFINLDEFDRAGKKYEYQVEERKIPGYTVIRSGNNFTNEYAPEPFSIPVTKTWDGGSGVRPEITVQLFRNDDATKPYLEKVLPSGVTTYTFENLPKYAANGSEYIYTINEADVNGYTKHIEENSYDITNKYTGGGTVEVEGTKTWDIPDDITVTTYPDVTIKLLQNGNETDKTFVLKDGKTSYSFTDLPKYAPDGGEYVYSVTEDLPNGYTNEITGNDIKNTYTGGEKVEITGNKTWNVPEGTKEFPVATIRLIRNGEETDQTRTITGGGTSYSFTDLPKYAPDGTEYQYTVKEEEVDGYESIQTGNDFENTYTGGEEISIEGTKTWNVPEGTTEFPESVTIKLYQNGEYYDSTTIENGGGSYTFTKLKKYAVNGEPFVYTVEEEVPGGYTGTPNEDDPYHLINTFNASTVSVEGSKIWDNPDAAHPEVTIQLWQDGSEFSTATVDPVTNKYKFEDLPEYSTDGHKYAYTVSEVEVDGYTSVKDGDYNFVNKYTPDEMSVTITKIWSNMPESMDDKKYPEITFNLTRSYGTAKEDVDSVTLKHGETSHTFEHLDKFAPNGQLYTYEVTEEAVKGYTQVKGENNTFTNTYTPDESKTISGTKTWVDVPAGSPYPAITLNLYQSAYGQEKVFKTIVLRKGETEYSFTGLPVYATDGTEFTYRVEEANVPNGYTASYDPANPLNITNTYTGGEKISISGTKTWADNSNSAMMRPGTVSLKLYRVEGENNRIPVANPSISWAATDSDVWHYTISNLPKYNTSGEEIVYAVEEETVPSYQTTYDAENPLNITNTISLGRLRVVKLLGENTQAKDEDRFTLTVSGKFADTTETTKNYIFANSSNSGNYAIGEEVDVTGVVGGETYTVSESTNAGDRFTSDLTVETAAAALADASVVPVLTVTNTSRNETTSISGTKTWRNVPTDVEYPTVTIILDRNGEFHEETTVKSDNTYSFDNLPVYDPSGDPYQYSVGEEEVDGYTSEKINDTDFANSFQTTSVRIYGRKVLEGDLSLRENQFQFKLYENGKLLKENIYNDADGAIDFGEISYDVRDKGIHTYTLKEVNDDIEGMTYDDKEHTVEVLVDNSEGVYTAQIISIDGNDYNEGDVAEFVNSYTIPTNDLVIQKFVAGSSDETFEFEVTVNGEPFLGEYTLNNSDETLTTDDGKIYLKANEKATLKDIEKGAEYVVKETDSKDHAILANGEATDTVTGTMVSKRDSGTPVVEFTNIPKDKLVIAKTRIGGNEKDLFRFSLKYSRANASDATPGDTATDSDSYDVGTSSNGKASSRKNFKTMLDDLFDNNGDPIYAFNGNYNLYAKDSDGKLVNKGTKKADKGEIALHGGELAVVNGFVVDTNFEITEILDDDSDYRLSQSSAENPYKGTIATGSNAVFARAVETEGFVNLVDFVNVFKYSEIRTRYTLRTVDGDGNFKDKAEGSIPSSGYAKFEVDSDLAEVEAKYFNDTYKADNKENTYDLVSVEVIKISANNTETILYSETGDTIGNALSEFNIHDLEKDAVYRINIDYIRMKGSVVLTKTSTDGKLLEGAKFQLYNELGDKVGEAHTTNKDGRITVENLLPGSYYFVETEAPKGYVKDETPVEFELSAENGKMKTAECSMTNELGTGSVVLKKVDIDGNGLADVSFDLYNADGVEVQTGLQTNADGQIKVDDLEIGSYYFVEQSTLPGFVMDDSQIHFEITLSDVESGTPVTLKPFINHYEENGILVLTKTDRDGIALSNATFDLYKEGMASPIRTNLITAADGKIIVTGLSVGNYYFVETKAPDGYITPTGDAARTPVLTVNFAENIRDGKEVTITVVNDLQTGSVSLRKTNADGSKALAGAEFSLYNGNDILIKAGLVTDVNGVITYDNLPIGSYYFKETKAPDGYVLPTGDDAITQFTVKFGEEAILNITNTTKPSGGNSGGGNGNDRTPGDTTGGPGATIPDNPVPLANMPTAGTSSDNGIIINDGQIPLAALPKTGDSPFRGLMALFTGLMLGLAALFGRKKKEDEQ